MLRMEDGRLSEGVCCLLVLNSVAQPAPARVARRRSPTLLETCTQLAVCKRPLHRRAAAKMSPRKRIGPEPVLATHVPPPPSAAATARLKPDQVPKQNRICLHLQHSNQCRASGTCRPCPGDHDNEIYVGIGYAGGIVRR